MIMISGIRIIIRKSWAKLFISVNINASGNFFLPPLKFSFSHSEYSENFFSLSLLIFPIFHFYFTTITLLITEHIMLMNVFRCMVCVCVCESILIASWTLWQKREEKSFSYQSKMKKFHLTGQNFFHDNFREREKKKVPFSTVFLHLEISTTEKDEDKRKSKHNIDGWASSSMSTHLFPLFRTMF